MPRSASTVGIPFDREATPQKFSGLRDCGQFDELQDLAPCGRSHTFPNTFDSTFMLNDPCIENLRILKGVLRDMSDASYATSLDVLSDSSIGQHVRHVLEFYLCLLHAQDSGIVNYDARQRDLELQTEVKRAIDTIDHLILRIDASRVDVPLTLKGDHGTEVPQPFEVTSNFQRELAFNLEHSIHHQALIKVGLRDLGVSMTGAHFGVAPSTVRNMANG